MLRQTAARIFAQHLDRGKPLWEIWMIEGVSENRWALLSKVHHCMVDGGLTNLAANPAEQVRVVRGSLRRPRASLEQAQTLVRGLSSAVELLRPLGSSSLTGSLGPHRTWSTAYVHLSDVKAIRSSFGGPWLQ